MRCCKGKFNRFKFGNIAIGFGNLRKINDTGRDLRIRFNGVGSLVGQLAGSLRDLSADFVSNGTVTAALEAIKLLDVDFSGDGTLTADLASFTGLLDEYPGAAAAYSIRLLSSTYSGALVEIRRSSDNALKSFYPDSNNELSLSSEDGASTTLSSWIGSDNGFIRTWFDQSGNANNAVQNSAANQPKFINTGALIIENGKPAIELNPSSTPNLVFNANLTQPFSYINLITPSDVSLPNPYILDGASRIIIGYRSNKFMIYAGAFLESAGATSSQHLRSSVFNGANSILKNNGSILVTGNAGVSNATTAYIGGNFVSALAYTQENIFYDSDKSPDFAGIETNINDFYSIY